MSSPLMKAVAFSRHLPIDDPEALQDIVLPRPQPGPRDLLVRVEAASVNPVDAKLRGPRPGAPALLDQPRVLGFDAAGVVEAVGNEVELFQPGDEVYYAGDATRPGCNAQYHLVDERLVGPKPTTLDFAEAAALPLATITAWELLFERMPFHLDAEGNTRSLLVIGGAGGVGSIAIQIARQRTDLTVIATASRPDTQAWVKGLGAHHVIDHSRPLAAQISELGIGAPAFVFSTTHTEKHAADIAELIAPQGRFALIDDPKVFDIMLFKRKAVSIHHELMFTRSIYGTPDMSEQGKILDAMAVLVDDGKIRTTLTRKLSPINAANLKTVHALIESSTSIGKIVLEGF